MSTFQQDESPEIVKLASAAIQELGDIKMVIVDEEGKEFMQMMVFSDKLKASSDYFRTMLDTQMKEVIYII